ncbi:HEAT repeat domain-containing protein [Haliangium sp.]|uniref:HEAT repeat domain-containing protein n=1 Tax=Haliangium sp. TaxID=2663208 RepID=UPI003D0A315C
MTAAELMAELQQDPAFVAREEQREEERERNRASYRRAARGLLDELAAAGFEVEAVADLRGRGRYPRAIPILVRWLPRVDDAGVKEDIIRTLSVPWARGATPLLLTEFEKAEDCSGTGLRWAIANALEVLASDEIADELIRLAATPEYGAARQMLVVSLGKLSVEGVDEVLIGLLSDDVVVGHAVMALGKRRAKAARSRIETLLSHPKAWVRDEVKKALEQIDATP